MATDDMDAADNPGVRACLEALERLHSTFLAHANPIADAASVNLVGLALSERVRVRDLLDAQRSHCDYDDLALSAMQEALRTTVRPGVSGFEVSLEEVAKSMGQCDYLTLWRNFFIHYLGNLFEWRLSAAEDGRTVEETQILVAGLRRTAAPEYARSVMKALEGEKMKDVDAAVRCFGETLAAE
jgi:hypothetical protein